MFLNLFQMLFEILLFSPGLHSKFLMGAKGKSRYISLFTKGIFEGVGKIYERLSVFLFPLTNLDF